MGTLFMFLVLLLLLLVMPVVVGVAKVAWNIRNFFSPEPNAFSSGRNAGATSKRGFANSGSGQTGERLGETQLGRKRLDALKKQASDVLFEEV